MPAPFPTDVITHWWVIERSEGPHSVFGPFPDADAAEAFANESPIADDQVAIDCLDDHIAQASLDELAAQGTTDVWIVTGDDS